MCVLLSRLCLKVILTPLDVLFWIIPVNLYFALLDLRFVCTCVLNMGPPYQLALLEHFHSQPLSVLCCKEAAALGHATDSCHPS